MGAEVIATQLIRQIITDHQLAAGSIYHGSYNDPATNKAAPAELETWLPMKEMFFHEHFRSEANILNYRIR